MYDVYMLKWQKLVNYIVTNKKSEHNCFKWLKFQGARAEAWRLQKIHARFESGVWFPYCDNYFEYQGERVETQTELARAMGITTHAIGMRLKRYRGWELQWPDDLYEFVDGWVLTRPTIKDGRLVGENKLYAHIFEGRE